MRTKKRYKEVVRLTKKRVVASKCLGVKYAEEAAGWGCYNSFLSFSLDLQ